MNGISGPGRQRQTGARLAEEYFAQFDITAADFVEKTAIAAIWKVRLPNRKAAALKIYHRQDMKNEAAGFSYLSACDGVAAARVYQQTGNAHLMEWLEGPSLGDLSRQGQDPLAARHLAEVAKCLHQNAVPRFADLPKVNDWLEGLLRLEFDLNCPQQGVLAINRCKNWAISLRQDQAVQAVLHGDLHHDNIRLAKRGYCAFDAKGVLGEYAYELANAFRNPRGAGRVVRNPARIGMLADTFAKITGLERQRLLKWAAVKCALSISWRCKGMLADDPETDLLGLLIREAENAG